MSISRTNPRLGDIKSLLRVSVGCSGYQQAKCPLGFSAACLVEMIGIPVPAIIVKLRVARFLELRVDGYEVSLDFLGQRAAGECGAVLAGLVDFFRLQEQPPPIHFSSVLQPRNLFLSTCSVSGRVLVVVLQFQFSKYTVFGDFMKQLPFDSIIL